MTSFQQRFQGRTRTIGRDGHIGILADASRPINKTLTAPLHGEENEGGSGGGRHFQGNFTISHEGHPTNGIHHNGESHFSPGHRVHRHQKSASLLNGSSTHGAQLGHNGVSSPAYFEQGHSHGNLAYSNTGQFVSGQFFDPSRNYAPSENGINAYNQGGNYEPRKSFMSDSGFVQKSNSMVLRRKDSNEKACVPPHRYRNLSMPNELHNRAPVTDQERRLRMQYVGQEMSNLDYFGRYNMGQDRVTSSQSEYIPNRNGYANGLNASLPQGNGYIPNSVDLIQRNPYDFSVSSRKAEPIIKSKARKFKTDNTSNDGRKHRASNSSIPVGDSKSMRPEVPIYERYQKSRVSGLNGERKSTKEELRLKQAELERWRIAYENNKQRNQQYIL